MKGRKSHRAPEREPAAEAGPVPATDAGPESHSPDWMPSQSADGNQAVMRMVRSGGEQSDPEGGEGAGGAFQEATAGAGGEVPYRDEMESAFGEDFSGVQAHRSESGPMGAIQAQAATTGEQVAFASSTPDKETVAHELTHVVQQRRAGGGGVQARGGVSRTEDPAEREAESAGARVARGEPVEVRAAPGTGAEGGEAIHRTPEGDGEQSTGEGTDSGAGGLSEAWSSLTLSRGRIRIGSATISVSGATDYNGDHTDSFLTRLRSSLSGAVSGAAPQQEGGQETNEEGTAPSSDRPAPGSDAELVGLVAAFQQARGLGTPDGCAGPGTYGALVAEFPALSYANAELKNDLDTADIPFLERVHQRNGLIFTENITAATVSDDMATELQQNHPQGVTVAVLPDFVSGVSGRGEMESRANGFATAHSAVGLDGGSVVMGSPVSIEDAGDAIEAVQSIHQGLAAVARSSANAQPSTESSDAPSEGGQSGDLPAWTKVRNLALFAHGMSWGMGLSEDNDYNDHGLHSTTRGGNPSNVEAFVDGLRSALSSDVRVQLFACSTGADDDRTSYEEWTGHEEGARHGEGSFADTLSDTLGDEASVYSHTTAGHTTENFAARVFGADAGPGEGGVHLFELMYPQTFINSELERLFPELEPEQREARYDSLRELMWSHYKDSVSGEHDRPDSQDRYDQPMGREMFTDPDGARQTLHADWRTWCTSRLDQVTAE